MSTAAITIGALIALIILCGLASYVKKGFVTDFVSVSYVALTFLIPVWAVFTLATTTIAVAIIGLFIALGLDLLVVFKLSQLPPIECTSFPAWIKAISQKA